MLTGALATAAGAALGAPVSKEVTGTSRALRIAFLTDVHLDTKKNCADGFARCLRKIESLKDRPNFIVQGGDVIYDALTRDAISVDAQYDLARDILRRNTKMRVEHVIGNHDIWGWLRSDAGTIRSAPLYGKAWWQTWSDQDLYRSFDVRGWHFVILDSMMPHPRHGYMAKLDQAQFDWFKNDLENTKTSTPVCVISHVPIISTSALMFGDGDRRGRWEVPSWLMHIDARRIKDLLNQHRNVKLCLSGHVHMHSRADYNGVKHIGFGAVCGAWWKGPMQETPPGFGVLDLFKDGSSKHYYISY